MNQLRYIFGEAEEKTKLQMANCLAVEPETAVGALMADNHLGYL